MQSGKSINIRQHNQPAGITPQRKKHIFVTNQNVTEIFEQDSLKRKSIKIEMKILYAEFDKKNHMYNNRKVLCIRVQTTKDPNPQ